MYVWYKKETLVNLGLKGRKKETLVKLGLRGREFQGKTRVNTANKTPLPGSCVCGEYDWQTMDQVRTQVETNIMGSLTVTKVSPREH